MSDIKHYLNCDNCSKMIELESIKIENEIVNKKTDKEHFVVVRYFFICPYCGQEYTCFYKDRMVNEYFRLGQKEMAQERMIMLWEIFEDGI